jgi:hypothetical protein
MCYNLMKFLRRSFIMSVSTSTISAYEALLLAFIDKGQLDVPFEKVPLEILQLDWEKARSIEVDPEIFTHDQAWEIIRRIGFCKRAILPLIDPAIIGVMDRLLDMPVLTIASCSGHSWSPMAWVTLIFREPEFGKKFLSACKNAARQHGVASQINGYIERVIGGFGPRMSLKQCVADGLPVTISCETEGPEHCGIFWRSFSAALDLFDGKGVVDIEINQLESHVPNDVRQAALLEVWNLLRRKEAL